MVKALHRAGIEVILDVVFNHTAEGDADGPTLSLRGFDNPTYYILDAGDRGRYVDDTGSGNTINGNETDRAADDPRLPAPLGAAHARRRIPLRPGVQPCPAARTASRCPSRRSCSTSRPTPSWRGRKIIAEAWDAAGLYQVATFARRPLGGVERAVSRRRAPLRAAASPAWCRHAGRRRGGQRQPVRSSAIATPSRSVNFITAHDGFTLNDLVTYDDKHNEANGEDEPRRHRRQPQLELRRSRDRPPTPASRRCAGARCKQLPDDPAPHVPGPADAADGRRGAAHAARQQQRLLPGRRDRAGSTGTTSTSHRDRPAASPAD